MADPKAFDPDAYLAKPFNPDAYLATPPATPTAAPTTTSTTTEPPYAYSDVGVPIGAPAGTGPLPPPSDPHSALNTLKRAITGTITGVPDLAISIGNAGVRASRNLPTWFGMAGVDPNTPAQEAPTVGPGVLRTMGGQAMPQDAGWGRKLGEAGLSALLGGGAQSALRGAMAAPTTGQAVWQAVKNLGTSTVLPTVGSQVAGETGRRLAPRLGIDPQTTELAGSILGGIGPAVAPGLYNRYSHNWYERNADPNAAAIAAQAERQGVTATPGMLGNNRIQDLERTIGSSLGARNYIDSRRQSARDAIGEALNRAADARGMTPESPTTSTSAVVTSGTIGERLSEAMRAEADALKLRSDETQRRLMERVGPNTPVLVRPVIERGEQLITNPAEGADALAQDAVRYRTGTQLDPLMIRDPLTRQPIMSGPPPMGHNQGPPLTPENPPAAPTPPAFTGQRPMNAQEAYEAYRTPPTPPTPPAPPPAPVMPTPANRGAFIDQGSPMVPYGQFAGWRTRLGKAIDAGAGGEMPAVPQLYAPATEAMRASAASRGVSAQDFNNTQDLTRQIMEKPALPGDPTGDYHRLMEIATKEPQAAYTWLQGGEQNPARLGTVEATGHPAVPGIMGDLIKQLGRETINNPSQGAAGPRNLADALAEMHPESRAITMGNQAAAINDIESLARSFNYPTNQTGLSRAVGSAADRTANRVVGAEAIGDAAASLSIPKLVANVASLGVVPLVNFMRAQGLNNPAAMNAMRGGAAPTPSIADLIASINAANPSNPARRPPGR